jgi:ribosomal protein S18 acetylase RimI-like enzyme
MTIKLLHHHDWQAWKKLRLQALLDAPTSFGSSYEEEVVLPDSFFQEELKKNDIFGAYVNNELVACVGFYVLSSLKTKHRGVMWGMYTDPRYRGKGIATRLIETLISHAKSRIIQLHLKCVTNNMHAVTLYQKHGFAIYGTEPRALKIGNDFFDEYLMVLNLDA